MACSRRKEIVVLLFGTRILDNPQGETLHLETDDTQRLHVCTVQYLPTAHAFENARLVSSKKKKKRSQPFQIVGFFSRAAAWSRLLRTGWALAGQGLTDKSQ